MQCQDRRHGPSASEDDPVAVCGVGCISLISAMERMSSTVSDCKFERSNATWASIGVYRTCGPHFALGLLLTVCHTCRGREVRFDLTDKPGDQTYSCPETFSALRPGSTSSSTTANHFASYDARRFR